MRSSIGRKTVRQVPGVPLTSTNARNTSWGYDCRRYLRPRCKASRSPYGHAISYPHPRTASTKAWVSIGNGTSLDPLRQAACNHTRCLHLRCRTAITSSRRAHDIISRTCEATQHRTVQVIFTVAIVFMRSSSSVGYMETGGVGEYDVA